VPKLLLPGGTLLMYAFFKDKEGNATGISKSEISGFTNALQLKTKTFGTERGKAASVWLEFEK
jgi:hypothetical protein